METLEELKILYKENLDLYNKLAIEFKEATIEHINRAMKFDALCVAQVVRGLSSESARMRVQTTEDGSEAMKLWRLAEIDKFGIETELKMAAAAVSYFYTMINTYPEEAKYGNKTAS
jgi:hypothetical protein